MSKIEWTQRTWNPLLGCSKISEGCRNCYAMRMAYRMAHMPSTRDRYEGIAEKTAGGDINWTGDIRLNKDALYMPVERAKSTIWFVNSMSDLFHEDVPFDWIDLVFDKMEASPQHIFQILTKRPQKMLEYFEWKSLGQGFKFEKWPLPNVWLGVSVEDQKAANERIPLLLRTPSAVRFLSCEPLLGPVDLTIVPNVVEGYPCISKYANQKNNPAIDWVIAGGESGPKARPMHPNWVRSLREQCQWAEVPFFFKQWGEWTPHGSLKNYTFLNPDTEKNYDGEVIKRVGKKAAGRKLDGREWNEMPHTAP